MASSRTGGGRFFLPHESEICLAINRSPGEYGVEGGAAVEKAIWKRKRMPRRFPSAGVCSLCLRVWWKGRNAPFFNYTGQPLRRANTRTTPNERVPGCITRFNLAVANA